MKISGLRHYARPASRAVREWLCLIGHVFGISTV
jgi:hypothetical protein